MRAAVMTTMVVVMAAMMMTMMMTMMIAAFLWTKLGEHGPYSHG
jgi:hypothetical protein